MEHSLIESPQLTPSRYGMHYFPDSLHYRDEDLQIWLPELKGLGASWIVLTSENKRAIPESFIQGLIQEKINPIIHFPLSLSEPVSVTQIEPILNAYAKWGVRYVIFFDKPNTRTSWGEKGWSQKDLTERFIEQFHPLAYTATQHGLTPVFPPMEPGGPYWDTVFLHDALELLQSQQHDGLTDKLVIAAYAWTNNKSLNWGSGGPERWPQSRPYRIPTGSQDQRGYRIFDWYQAISKSVLQKTCPIILLQSGMPNDPATLNCSQPNDEKYKDTIINILRLLNHENVYDSNQSEQLIDEIPDEMIACNFWILSAQKNDPNYLQAWFLDSSHKSLTAQAVLDWYQPQTIENDALTEAKVYKPALEKTFTIPRFLLLPSKELLFSGPENSDLNIYIEKYHPTLGFSAQDAANAAVVTVAGDENEISDDILETLRENGCFVKRL